MDSGDDDGLRRIRELIFVPSGNLNLSVLGLGLDARGEIYVTGNVTGTPFGNTGVVVRSAPADDGPDD